MTGESQAIETIFGEAIEIALPQDRALYLDIACQGNIELRSEVERLVEDHFQAGNFLESPPATVQWARQEVIQENPGTVIGPYKLLQQIGEGGMGVVFMAEQTEPIQRTVALKIIKPGMDTRQVIARFEAERQALALMDHPNIARVLDAGTTGTGRPYFVMDLVKGVPITTYCDQQHLPVRERLELVSAVCHAVQHAHQKGIIHRDLKPSNVLVAEYDGKPVPKIIDFGVAKATAQKLTEKTMFTELGQMVGTVEYMSPEQARFNQLDVDTRSDVYSLGVLLYELLTGSTPFGRKRLNEAAFDEMLRIIREEEPPKPSTRLSSSDALPSIAANRSLEPLKLNRLVQGELDWIVMKALEKDRNRRYETANGLAADIQHYLDDEPVQACPPSAAYRFRKYARRHKAALAVMGLVSTLLVAAVVFLTVTNARIRHASEAKDAALATAREAVDQMLTRTADEKLVNVPLAEPLRKALLEDALRFYEGFLRQAETDPSIRQETANMLRRVSNMQRELGRSADARKSQERSVEFLRLLADSNPEEPTYREQLADAHTNLAFLVRNVPTASSNDEAEVHLREAVRIYDELQRENPTQLVASGNTIKLLGDLQYVLGHGDEAERLYYQALAQLEREAEHSRDPVKWLNLCWTRQGLAGNFDDHGPENRPAEALKFYQDSLDAADRALELQPGAKAIRFARARTLKERGDLHRASFHVDEAIDHFRQVVKETREILRQSPWDQAYWVLQCESLEALVDALQSSGRLDDANQVVREACNWLQELSARVRGDEYVESRVLLRQIEYSSLLWSFGQETLARELESDARELIGRWQEKGLNNSEGRLARAAIELVTAFEAMLAIDPSDTNHAEQAYGSFRQAAKEYNDLARSAAGNSRGVTNIYVGMVARLGITQNRGKGMDEVEEQFTALLSLLLKDFSYHNEYRQMVGHKLRQSATILGHNREYLPHAESLLREAIRVYDGFAADFGNWPADWHLLADTHRRLGSALYKMERFDEAGDEYRRAAEICRRRAAQIQPDVVESKLSMNYRGFNWLFGLPDTGDPFDWYFLAMAHWQLGEKDEARTWYDKAVEWTDKNQSNNEELLRFRAESAELLGISEPAKSTNPASQP